MKKTILILSLFVYSLSSPLIAKDITKTIDELDNEKSMTLVTTQIANIFSPLPEDIIKNIGFGLSRNIHTIKAGALDNQTGLHAKHSFWSTSKLLMFHYSEKISIGFEFYAADAIQNGQIDANSVYEDHINISYWHLLGKYTFYKEKNLSLSVYGGAGTTTVEYSISQYSQPSVDEGNRITPTYDKRKGFDTSFQVGALVSYHINSLWTFGIGGSYLKSGVDDMEDSAGNKISGFNASGTLFRIFTGINL